MTNPSPKTKVTKRVRKVRAWADVGSHGGIFMFEVGLVADRYPKLLHIYHEKVSPNLIPVTIIYQL